jgi:hypothetical protein
VKPNLYSATMSFRAPRQCSGPTAPRGIPKKILIWGYTIGIPRRKRPRNDMIVAMVNSPLVHKQGDMISYVNLLNKLEETLIFPTTSVDG